MTYIKVIGFDWGGVLNDYTKHTELMARHIGISIEDFKKAVSNHVHSFHLGLPEMEFWSRVCSDAGIEKPSAPFWIKSAELGIKINEELFEVVRRVRNSDYKTAMISNAELPNRDYINEHIKGTSYDLFDHYILSCEIGAVKPDREFFYHTGQLFGMPPEQLNQLVVIDDNPLNIQGAISAGAQAILHITNQQTTKELSDLLKTSLV